MRWVFGAMASGRQRLDVRRSVMASELWPWLCRSLTMFLTIRGFG